MQLKFIADSKWYIRKHLRTIINFKKIPYYFIQTFTSKNKSILPFNFSLQSQLQNQVKLGKNSFIHFSIHLFDTGYFQKNFVIEANTDSVFHVVNVRGHFNPGKI